MYPAGIKKLCTGGVKKLEIFELELDLFPVLGNSSRLSISRFKARGGDKRAAPNWPVRSTILCSPDVPENEHYTLLSWPLASAA